VDTPKFRLLLIFPLKEFMTKRRLRSSRTSRYLDERGIKAIGVDVGRTCFTFDRRVYWIIFHASLFRSTRLGFPSPSLHSKPADYPARPCTRNQAHGVGHGMRVAEEQV